MWKRAVAGLASILLMGGCGSRSRSERAIGEAYVAPATINLRRELSSGNHEVVATAKRGERLQVLARRRVFVKVRTSAGLEGWTDGRLLFTPEQMADLRWLAEQAARLPCQGIATTYTRLNLHTQPSRQAPSFYQMREGEHVEVVAHRLTPRNLSQALKESLQMGIQGPADDWSLVRTKDGKAGWALFRMLTMNVPDEVAQYAEGHLITSYFSLGEVKDTDKVKPVWLWTTIAGGQQPYEFDSIRVFVWSLRRHRYETSYIERNLEGYYPVVVLPPSAANKPPINRGSPAPQDFSGFSIITREKDGRTYRRTYGFQGFRVRLINKELVNFSEPLFTRPAASAPELSESSTESWRELFEKWITRFWRRRH